MLETEGAIPARSASLVNRMSTAARVTTPLVSVLMSCYNAKRWLHEAGESVLAQTFEDFEFILVDDGSTDDTWNVIQRYRERDQRVVAICKKNTGLADSLNVGIAKARGTWIARLDADDVCEPTRLQEQVAYVRDNPAIILLGTGCVEIDERSDVVKTHAYPSAHAALVRHLVRVQRFFPHSSAFYLRDAVRRQGGYRTRMRRAQDWDLWLRLSEYGRLGCLERPLVRIRKHEGQISHGESGRRQISDCRAGIVSYFLRRRGLIDPIERDNATWLAFLLWLEMRLEEEALFDERRAYDVARAEFVRYDNPLVGAAAFAARVLTSSHALALVKEKLVGSSLPERLANEWIAASRKLTCAS